jgi:hypothetical protein
MGTPLAGCTAGAKERQAHITPHQPDGSGTRHCRSAREATVAGNRLGVAVMPRRDARRLGRRKLRLQSVQCQGVDHRREPAGERGMRGLELHHRVLQHAAERGGRRLLAQGVADVPLEGA